MKINYSISLLSVLLLLSIVLNASNIQQDETSINLIEYWDGDGITGDGSKPSEVGWNNTDSASIPWSQANTSGGCRFRDDPSGYTHEDGLDMSSHRQLMLRFDNSSYSSSVYSYPVSLTGETPYYFSFDFLCGGSASAPQNITFAISPLSDGDSAIITQTMASTSDTKIYRNGSLTFIPDTTGQYYLTISGDYCWFGVTNLSIVESAIDDPTLKTLSVDVGELDPAFDPEEEEYELTVPYGTTQVTIDAEASQSTSTIYMINNSDTITDGVVFFETGGTDVDINVKAYNNSQKTYIIAITPDDGINDTTLQSISLSVSDIDPVFDPETTEYTTTVPIGTQTVDITAIANYTGASVTGDGTITLDNGSASANIVVASQEGGYTQTYNIKFEEADGNNYALSLPGESGAESNVDISGLSSMPVPFTIEMWFKPDGTQAYNAGLLFNRPENIGLEYASSWQGDNYIRFMAPSGEGETYGSTSMTPTVNTDDWHHIAAVMTDSTRTIYLDGEKSGVETVDAGTFTTFNFGCDTSYTYLGWDASSDSRAFKGLIDEVRIWNSALSIEEIENYQYKVLSGDEEGLLTYYNFDLNSPTRAIDLSDSQHTGNITGGSYVESFVRANLKLDSISIEGASLSPTFSNNIFEYHAVLPEGVTSINVVATPKANTTTVSGTGNIAVEDTGTFVITSKAGEYSQDFTIHYQHDASLTLMHSYTFEDGTAKDFVGGADGILYGEAYIKQGVCIADSLDSYVSFPGDEIAINTYPSMTVELYTREKGNTNKTDTINESSDVMYYYFGSDNGGTFGCNYTFVSPIKSSISCLETSEPYNTENNVKAGTSPLDDGSIHHIVSVITLDSLIYYLDAEKQGSVATDDDNKIFNLGNDYVYLFKSGYKNDNTWLGNIYEFNIYKGAMDEATIQANESAFPVDNIINDATLATLTVNGDSVEGFNSANLKYTETLPYGTTEIPVIEATVKEDTAKAVITQPTSLDDTAIVVVTSGDGNYTNTYYIAFRIKASPSDSTLSSITVDGDIIEGFDPATLAYEVEVVEGSSMPTIGATTTNEDAYLDITDASNTSDTTFIKVTSEDSTATQTYIITYEEITSITEKQAECNISIYPTVSNSEFTLKTNGQKTTTTVYTMSGRVVKQISTEGTETKFTLTKPQMYIVKVDTDSKSQVFRIFKK